VRLPLECRCCVYISLPLDCRYYILYKVTTAMSVCLYMVAIGLLLLCLHKISAGIPLLCLRKFASRLSSCLRKVATGLSLCLHKFITGMLLLCCHWVLSYANLFFSTKCLVKTNQNIKLPPKTQTPKYSSFWNRIKFLVHFSLLLLLIHFPPNRKLLFIAVLYQLLEIKNFLSNLVFFI